jgi:dihydroorotate dehydrogenase (NAD+) catalytic subunit
MTGTTPLAREVLGVRFQNPLLLASGTAGYGRELDGVMDLDALGGIVTKAVSLEPRAGNRPPRVAEFRGGMLNSVGLANPGLREVRETALPWLLTRLRAARVVVNVVGFEVHEYAEVIAGLDDLTGITAYELNLSCPNTAAGGLEFGADPVSVAAIVAAARRATRRPLIAKLSPALPDIAGMALVARDAGADGIAVVNTLPGMALDESGAPKLGNGNGGASGPVLLPAGVLAVRRVTERLPGTPVVGVGGIRNAAEVHQYLSAGASLVAIGTGALADPRLPSRILRDLGRNHG